MRLDDGIQKSSCANSGLSRKTNAACGFTTIETERERAIVSGRSSTHSVTALADTGCHGAQRGVAHINQQGERTPAPIHHWTRIDPSIAW